MCAVFFFFKQKTAYEMRISDGVQTCALPNCAAGPAPPARRATKSRSRPSACAGSRQRTGQVATSVRSAGRRDSRSAPAHRPDRQSVVAGKSVSVRVDIGGRRIITKKTEYTHDLEKTYQTLTNLKR